jgi:hypothetical protein
MVEKRRVGLRRTERLVEESWKSLRLARGTKKSEQAKENRGDAGHAAQKRTWGKQGDVSRERREASALPQFARSCHRPFRRAPSSGAT